MAPNTVQFHAVSWNLQGKSLKDLQNCWDQVQLEGLDVLGLQEVGGFASQTEPWKLHDFRMDNDWGFYVSNFPKTHHSVALGFPARLLPYVTEVVILSAGIGAIVKQDSVKRYFVSAHLPHGQRTDCVDQWLKFQNELDDFLHGRRLHDPLIICIDANYELGAAELTTDASSCDERSSLSNLLVRSHGLEFWPPNSFTWSNTRGSTSKIDYVLASQPLVSYSSFRVIPDSDKILGSDHRAVLLTQTLRPHTGSKPRKPGRHRSGKWSVNTKLAVTACNDLASNLDLSMRDLTMSSLSSTCQQASYRDGSCRYKDPPEIRALIHERKLLRGAAAKDLGRQIVQKRAVAKQKWLTEILDRGAAGDYKAISYFKRRQSSLVTHCNYLTRAGGRTRALCELRSFYRLKYTPPDPRPKNMAIEEWRWQVGPTLAPRLITHEEIDGVLATCKRGKSCGSDGVSYEFLQIAMQTDLRDHLVDYFNGVLLGLHQVPQEWLISRLTFIPKTVAPLSPKDLRPIVLSSVPGKVFTKLLLYRLRAHFPQMIAGQLSSIPGAQTLEGSCSLQQCVRLSNEYALPLVIAKLDIASAFDHLAISKFLRLLGPHREAEILLLIMTYSSVLLSMADCEWTQDIDRGVLQGSSYSAEIFARTVDYFLGDLIKQWQLTESTWISAEVGGVEVKLFNILFADDLILLATSFTQLQRMLIQVRDCLAVIGLSLSLKKCQVLAAPFVQKASIEIDGTTLELVDHFRFLGVLIGFKLSCQAVLSARLAMATNSFWGHFKLLKRPVGSIRKKLHLLNSYVTSKWRWMSASVRPIQAVQKTLKTLHTSFLGCLCRLSSDPFMPLAYNWIVRRRAARMTAQCLGHVRWESLQAQAFCRFWAHAARIPPARNSPITIILGIRNEDWLARYGHIHKCCLVFWPNAARFLQKAWEDHRLVGQPPYWYQGSQDRLQWDEMINRWLSSKDLNLTGYYQNLESCDLQGRMLLQVGETFKLLAMRHPPIEEPYPSSYKYVPPPDEDDDLQSIVFCSDGSSKLAHGSYGVTIAGPYADVHSVIIAQGRIDGYCTNIRAEIVAACNAIALIKQLRRHSPHIPIVFLTDSDYVLQILDESLCPTCHVPDTNNLLSLWQSVCSTVSAKHVKAHKGHALNELADKAAKEAYHFNHYRRVIRDVSFNKVYLLKEHQPLPPFHAWL